MFGLLTIYMEINIFFYYCRYNSGLSIVLGQLLGKYLVIFESEPAASDTSPIFPLCCASSTIP